MNAKKQYIIPTYNWLKPLESFVTEDLGSEGLIMLAEYLEKEKIIVKITKGSFPQYKIINNLFNFENNFVHTKCTFECLEDNSILDKEYEDVKQFCNAKNDKGDLITLELMKRYEGSLNKYKYKITLEEYYTIINQLLLAQLVVFEKYGFVHNDITLSNILYKQYINIRSLTYKINNKNIEITGKIYVILSDFGKSKIYNPKIFTEYNPIFLYLDADKYNINSFDDQHTLAQNLINTINNTIILLQPNIKKNLSNIITEFINSQFLQDQLRFSRKNLRNLFKRDYDYMRYNKEEISIGIHIVNAFSRLINNKVNELIPYFNV